MARSTKPIREWRLVRPEKGPGLFLWFDPECEEVELIEREPQQNAGVADAPEEDDYSDVKSSPSENCGSQGELPF